MESRLPVYILVDVSGSMRGESITSVSNGLNTLVDALIENPQARGTAHLSLITFADEAKQVVPLTALEDFQLPTLEADGCTALGGALKLVSECWKREKIPSTRETKGDWRPLVFIFTDGEPTDDITEGLNEFRTIHWGQKVCCATPMADIKTLKNIAERVLKMNDTTPATFDSFFKFVT